jgi:hypothetical protein
MDPEISFFGPLEGWSEFFQFVSRSTYGAADHEPGVGWSDKAGYLGFLGHSLLSQFTLLGAALGLVGLLSLRRHARTLGALLLGAVCVSLLLILLLDREYSLLGTFVFRVYPLPAFGVLALLIALGLVHVGQFFHRLPTPAFGWMLGASSLAAVVILPLAVHAGQNYRGDYIWAERFARAVLDEVPANGVLFLSGDLDALPIGYLRLVTGYREDVAIYSTKSLVFRDRPFDPWVVRNDADMQSEALQRFVDQSDQEVCVVGIQSRFGDRYGLRWNGLTSCYDRDRDGVYSSVSDRAIKRYLALQSSRDWDGWTMMGADSIDGQMVHVLLAESFTADESERPHLYEAIDRARFGLRGKTAFIRYSLDAGVPLATEESLALLEEALTQKDRAYVKQDMIALYQLMERELRRAGRDDEALRVLWRAVELKPAWRNALLPPLLSELFGAKRVYDVHRLARLDPDFAVIDEIYDFYTANREVEGFGLNLKREGLELNLFADGTFEVR